MSGDQVFLIEMVLVFGLVLAWAVWELTSLRRSRKRDQALEAERARHAEGQHRPDQG
ncbi:hypothetical protein Bresu_3050 [Brevundimonas subvibrioides ATCC 15264]|jgi:hypothetical protein|uniref:Heme exporter protein D n=1 Tax=Brevundimonas subvibrioides (strain ATCC 15264 / DSM 4735 / LMG 14903 / NBRC 16000 / CB 81) TaxID=633149 RepID=D9QP93_BRESC|nr:hypothetical protein Bresu_3050 [Brevundimonas subvibrioides ATCC 15264]